MFYNELAVKTYVKIKNTQQPLAKTSKEPWRFNYTLKPLHKTSNKCLTGYTRLHTSYTH